MLKKTPLNEWHRTMNAHMGLFGGYEMPLWYPSGVKREHLAVICRAGIFDTSHMSVLLITGPDAFSLLQHCFTRDLNPCVFRDDAPLSPLKCMYGVFLNEKGFLVDDALMYPMDRETFMCVVNSGMGETVTDHLSAHMGNRMARIQDLSTRLGKLDIQGPMSAKILARVLEDPDKTFSELKYFSFKGRVDPSGTISPVIFMSGHVPVVLSRTGYTGEFGCEVYCAREALPSVWNMLVEAGKDSALIPCGLAARDSLRTGAVLPLAHQDTGDWPFINHPWSCALPYDEGKKFTKSFLGEQALLNAAQPFYTYPFTGFDVRKVSVSDPARVLDDDGAEIGTVLTCVSDMAMGRAGDRVVSISSPDRPDGFEPAGLCCGFIRADTPLAEGRIVELQDRRRRIRVMVTGDIRPGRTARLSFKEIMNIREICP